METQLIIDILLKLLNIFLSWQVIFLFIIMYFRNQIREMIPGLSKRLTKASVAGTTFEFSEAGIKAFRDAIDSGAEQLKDRPEELAQFVKLQVRKLPEIGTLENTKHTPSSMHSILWVDDKPTNNYYEANYLKQFGASVDFAISTEEAKNLLELKPFDL
jgi:hypothetical protein